MKDRRPPSELTPWELRERIVRKARGVYLECDQCIRDVDYWNRINPNETPQDAEWFVLMRAQMRRCLEQLGEPIPGETT